MSVAPSDRKVYYLSHVFVHWVVCGCMCCTLVIVVLIKHSIVLVSVTQNTWHFIYTAVKIS